MSSPKLYNVAEVAALFGVHPVTVRKKVAAREWPCLQIGPKTLRFTSEHVDSILRDTERPARTA